MAQAGNRFAERKKREKRQRFSPMALIIVILFLLAFGFVMVYSTTSYDAVMEGKESNYYLMKQIKAALLGTVGMLGVTFFPYDWMRRNRMFAFAAYAISVVLIVLIIPFGVTKKGAARWYDVGGVSLQPAEIAKIGIIIFMADLLYREGRRLLSWKYFLLCLVPPFVMSLLIYSITNNLSSAVIVGGISVMMLFVAVPDYKRFILMGTIFAAMAGGYVAWVVKQAEKIASNPDSSNVNFRGARILAWLDLEGNATDKGFQTMQSLYAIGSGGIVGKGLGQSMQKLGTLPEASNDMVFSVICEELGVLGGIAVMLLFVVLIWQLVLIAGNADRYGAFLVTGVMAHIAIQVILNIAVVTNIMPNTGITLPFISSGGSALVFMMCELGLAFSVSRGIKLRDV